MSVTSPRGIGPQARGAAAPLQPAPSQLALRFAAAAARTQPVFAERRLVSGAKRALVRDPAILRPPAQQRRADSGPAASDADARSGACGGLRILMIEDIPAEAELAARQVSSDGIAAVWQRVDQASTLQAALQDFRPHIVLADYTLPGFDGFAALAIVRAQSAELPFIFVSGTIDEERAVEAFRRGADDYVSKQNLSRLAPAIGRALEVAAGQEERRRQEAQIMRLTRVLRMLSGINALVLRVRDQRELFDEACRLAVTIGGYSAAIVMLRQPGSDTLGLAVRAGGDGTGDRAAELLAADGAAEPRGIVRQVLDFGVPFVCNDTTAASAAPLITALAQIRVRSLIALPLLLEETPIGVLVLTAADAGVFGDEELKTLGELSSNLSFALQYQHKDNEVNFLSYFDQHTGLPKRALFCERLGRLLARKSENELRYGVAVFDIERLSLINDSFGRHIGDTLLRHVAERLRRQRPDTDLLAHFGGGTFAMALLGADDIAATAAAVQRTLSAMTAQPFGLQGREVPISVKCGSAIYPEDGQEADELVQRAEAALRDARAAGQRHMHYNMAQHSAAMARLALEHKLRAAIDTRQFELHYQPIIGVGSGRIESVEGLIRWRDPERGLISPAEFLPLLESTGLIGEVGALVAQQAARDWVDWHRSGLPAIRVAVNVSALELQQPRFAERFLELTRTTDGSAVGLDIEITESALLDHRVAEVAALRRLRAAGVCVAIDDFGTGYSSLSRLADLPIDTLKIDRSFISRLPGDRPDTTVVSTIIALAHAFGLTVVAEGVETREQADLLRSLGCDELQGFLFSRPLPRAELICLLGKRNHTDGIGTAGA